LARGRRSAGDGSAQFRHARVTQARVVRR